MRSKPVEDLDALRLHTDIGFKGREFERLTERYLQSQFKAHDIYRKPNEKGVDLWFTDGEGRLVAAQMKCYHPDTSVSYDDLTNFTFEADRFGANHLVLLHTSRTTTSADEVIAERNIQVVEFDQLTQVDCWTGDASGTVEVLSPLQPLPEQEEALQAELAAPERAQFILPPRWGKSLVQVEIALRSDSSLILVSSMSLVEQMYEDLRRQDPHEPVLLVYSGEGDGEEEGEESEGVVDTAVFTTEATTQPSRVREFRARHQHHTIISTYHSAKFIRDANTTPFDVMLLDEAHRVSGLGNLSTEIGFKIALFDKNIAARRRRFFTATPRHHSDTVKQQLTDNDLPVFSMDNEELYGPVVFTRSWDEAVEQKRMVPMKIAIAVTTDEVTAKVIADNSMAALGDGTEERMRDIAAALALFNTADAAGIRSVLTYHNRNQRANDFRDLLKDVARALGRTDVTVHSVGHNDKHDHIKAAKRAIDSAEDAQGLNIVCSVDLFAEGVTIRGLDAVMFVDNRNTMVRTVQSIARPLTVTGWKSQAVALFPVFAASADVADDAVDESRWSGTSNVFDALFAHGITPVARDGGFAGLRPGLVPPESDSPVFESFVFMVPSAADDVDCLAMQERLQVVVRDPGKRFSEESQIRIHDTTSANAELHRIMADESDPTAAIDQFLAQFKES